MVGGVFFQSLELYFWRFRAEGGQVGIWVFNAEAMAIVKKGREKWYRRVWNL